MSSDSLHTDQALYTRLKEGDARAYTEIFERYKSLLYNHAYRLLANHDEAEDIVQEVFLNLWQKRDDVNISASLASYLYIAVRNRIFKQFARKKVADRYVESLQAFWNAGHNDVDEKVIEQELAVIIEREVAALPEKMRQVFLLSRAGTHSYKEIGEQLDISEKTVRNQVYNAVQLLKLKINHFLTFLLF